MGACETCGRDLLSLSLNMKDVKRLSANLPKSNTKLGEVLHDVGWQVGEETSWKQKRCCMPCFQMLGRWNTSRMALTSLCCRWKERTGRSLPSLSSKNRRRNYNGPVDKAGIIKDVEGSHYGEAMKKLKLSPSARKVWLKDLKRTIRKEMKSLAASSELFPRTPNPKSSQEFKWSTVISKIKSEAPTLYTTFFAAISRLDKTPSNITTSRLGMMFLIPLHHRRPLLRRFVPLAVATALCGAKGKTINSLRGLGLSKGRKTVRRHIKSNDEKLVSWKTSIEEEQTGTPTGTVQTVPALHPSYTLVVDNVQRMERTVHASSEAQNKMHNGLALKNRISFRDVPDVPVMKACDLPLTTYLPQQKDYQELRMRMRILVERILKANLDVFADAEPPMQHIPHLYSEECSRKSEYINFGIIHEDPGTIEGMTTILRELSKYVPDNYPIVLHGDQKTLEVACGAKLASSTVPTPKQRLREFYPVPSDFHFRAVIVGDVIADLYSPTKHNERGTLKHLKEVFGHRSVNDQVSSFNHTDDFLLFIACAFVVGFSTEFLEDSEAAAMDTAGPSTSSSCPTPNLSVVADEIVRRIWYQVPMNRISDIVNAPVEHHNDQLCFCKEDEDWYCSAQCVREGGGENEPDELLDYVKRCTWWSLFNECIRDAEREGDGAALMGYWRISMPELYQRGHDKYVAVAHRMLSGISGCFPPRIREEVIHNRTVNPTGGRGKNQAADFLQQQNNGGFKGTLQHSFGRYSEQTVERAGKISGSSGDSTSSAQHSKPRFARYKDDVKTFRANYRDMFCAMEGRVIPSLSQKPLRGEISKEQARAFKKTLLELNSRIDKEAIFI